MKMNLTFLTMLLFAFIFSVKANGPWNQLNGPFGGSVNCFATVGTKIYAGTNNDIFVSENHGNSWTSTGFNNSCISLAANDSIIYAGTYYHGVYQLSSIGGSWEIKGYDLNTLLVNSLLITDNVLLAGTSQGVYSFVDGGVSWTRKDSEKVPYISNMVLYGDSILAGSGNKLICSSDQGNSWSVMDSTDKTISFLCTNGKNIFISSFEFGVRVLADNGTSWKQTSIQYNAFALSSAQDGTIYAGTSDGIYSSVDNGFSWQTIKLNEGWFSPMINAIATVGSDIYCGTSDGGVYFSNDASTWTLSNNGINYATINSLIFANNTLFAGTQSGMFTSEDKGNSWQINNPYLQNATIKDMIKKDNELFVATQGNISSSNNNGLSWSITELHLSCGLVPFVSIVTHNNILVAGSDGYGIFISNDNGDTWIPKNKGLQDTNVRSIVSCNSVLFVSTYAGIFKSINNGESWEASDNGLTDKINLFIFTNGNSLFVNTQNGIFQSNDLGAHWELLTDINDIFDMIFFGDTIIAGGYDGVYVSTNNGNSWDQIAQNNDIGFVYCLARKGSDLYAGTRENGIWKTSIANYVNAISEINTKEKNILIYPNPAVNQINLANSSTGKQQFEILNALGQSIYQSEFTGTTNVDISNFQSGIYFVKYFSSEAIVIERFVKE